MSLQAQLEGRPSRDFLPYWPGSAALLFIERVEETPFSEDSHMNMPNRPSGLDAVGDIPWGSHFCQFYGERGDLVDSLVPYFKAGLEHNEQCLWITSAPFGAEDATAMLRTAVPDLSQRLERRQIEIIGHDEWYTRAGAMTADQVLAAWIERQKRSLEQGYAGLRLTGNTFWLERKDWGAFVDYEERVSETFRDHNILALCSYCVGKCQSQDVIDVVRNHEFALIRQAGRWDLIESAPLKTAKASLRQLNRELEERVDARTGELKRALASRDEFLSVASHELKTPITSLQLYVDALHRAFIKEAVPRDVALAKLDKAKRQCSRLENVINEMLDISRASGGPLPLALQKVELSDLVRSVSESFAEALEGTGARLQVTAERPVIGAWDPLRLEQVVTNLISNAIKHAPGADIELQVTGDESEAKLTVKDFGPGIQTVDRDRVFDRFFQSSLGPKAGGFGLGLWIVRQIVEAHGGQVTVSSSNQEGATFEVTLPIRTSGNG